MQRASAQPCLLWRHPTRQLTSISTAVHSRLPWRELSRSGWPVVNGRLNSGSTECNTSVEITSDIAVSADSRQFAAQLNVLSQLFRTAGKLSRKTHASDTNSFSYKLRNNEAKSPLNDADFVRLSTSLSLSVADAAAIVCRRRRHGSLREDLTTTSHRCLVAVAVLGLRRHHGAITDETTTTSRRCLVVVSTVFASLPLATLYCWLLCYY